MEVVRFLGGEEWIGEIDWEELQLFAQYRVRLRLSLQVCYHRNWGRVSVECGGVAV